MPPVGQAAGLGVGRRRNKVGASDSVAAEDAQAQVRVISVLSPIVYTRCVARSLANDNTDLWFGRSAITAIS